MLEKIIDIKQMQNMVYDIFHIDKDYLKEEKSFLVIISVASKIEGFKNLELDDEDK